MYLYDWRNRSSAFLSIRGMPALQRIHASAIQRIAIRC